MLGKAITSSTKTAGDNPIFQLDPPTGIIAIIGHCVRGAQKAFPEDIMKIADINFILSDMIVQKSGAGIDPVQGPEEKPASESDIQLLIDVLQDDHSRAALIEQLKTADQSPEGAGADEAEANAEGDGEAPWLNGKMEEIEDGLGRMAVEIVELARHLANPEPALNWLTAQVDSEEARAFWIDLFLQLGLVLAAGLLARFVVRWVLTPARTKLETADHDSMMIRVPFLLMRTVLDLMPIAAFAATAYWVLHMVGSFGVGKVGGPVDPRAAGLGNVAETIILSIVIARSILAAGRFAVTPLAPNLRLLPMDDAHAAYVYVWLSRFTNFGVYGLALVMVLPGLGFPPEAAGGVRSLVGFVMLTLFVVLVLQIRQDVEDALKAIAQNRQTMTRVLLERVGDVWHILSIAYAVFVFVIWALRIEGGFPFLLQGTLGTLAALSISQLVILAAGSALERAFRVSSDLTQRYPGLDQRAGLYLPVARVAISVLVLAVAAIAIIESWNGDVLAALASESGQQVMTRVLVIILVLVISLMVWEVSAALITRRLEAKDDNGNVVIRSQRTRTLLPLARSVLTITIGLIAILTILSELGINIAPLLAGAGVVGLAIGFGAQSLVKDVITGMFILVEDAIQVGDVVSVGSHTGTVESLSVRSVRLRDLNGSVHSVPFGAIESVKNLTKDWSFYLLDVGVAYREDTDRVVALMREVDEDLRSDPAFSSDILEPLDVLGVNEFADSAVIIRARIKTRPLQQWRIGREYNRRMKYKFDEHQVEIPFPHQTIYFGEDHDGNAPAAPVRFVQEKPRGKKDTSSDQTTPQVEPDDLEVTSDTPDGSSQEG
ncbi:ybiO [Symbiodinium microadriaticum]|nr:ybiO [Symbiodinium microadriaticum]